MISSSRQPGSQDSRAYSERTVNVTPTFFLKWLCTRMKSSDDGMKTTVFALWTADFKIAGNNYNASCERSIYRGVHRGTDLSSEVLETPLRLVLGVTAVKLDELLAGNEYLCVRGVNEDLYLVDTFRHLDRWPSPFCAYPPGNIPELVVE